MAPVGCMAALHARRCVPFLSLSVLQVPPTLLFLPLLLLLLLQL